MENKVIKMWICGKKTADGDGDFSEEPKIIVQTIVINLS